MMRHPLGLRRERHIIPVGVAEVRVILHRRRKRKSLKHKRNRAVQPSGRHALPLSPRAAVIDSSLTLCDGSIEPLLCVKRRFRRGICQPRDRLEHASEQIRRSPRIVRRDVIHGSDTIADEKLFQIIDSGAGRTVRIIVKRKDIQIDSVVHVSFFLRLLHEYRSVPAQLRKAVHVARVRLMGLQKDTLREQRLRIDKKHLIILAWHADVNIVIPGDEAAVTHGAEQRSLHQIVPELQPLTDRDKTAQKLQLNLTQALSLKL